jgi:hypothetical protein
VADGVAYAVDSPSVLTRNTADADIVQMRFMVYLLGAKRVRS